MDRALIQNTHAQIVKDVEKIAGRLRDLATQALVESELVLSKEYHLALDALETLKGALSHVEHLTAPPPAEVEEPPAG